MTETQNNFEPTPNIPSQNTEQIQPPAKKTKKKTALIIVIIAVLLIGITVFFLLFMIPYFKYNEAKSLMENKEYESAMVAFYDLDGFMDSKEMHKECQYLNAVLLSNDGKYTDAIMIFEDLGNYKDSKDLITECQYLSAIKMIEEAKYDDAITIFEKLTDYKDSKDKINECNYLKACDLLNSENYKEAQAIFEDLKNYKDSKDQIKECKYKSAVKAVDDGEIEKAYKAFADLGGYKDSKQRAQSIKKTYLRIISKDNIFVEKSWIPPDGERSHIVSKVIDENTMEFHYMGAASLTEHVDELMVATWDKTSGTLIYSDSTKYFDTAGIKSVMYTDGHGYFYYESGCLHYVNEREGRTKSFR